MLRGGGFLNRGVGVHRRGRRGLIYNRGRLLRGYQFLARDAAKNVGETGGGIVADGGVRNNLVLLLDDGRLVGGNYCRGNQCRAASQVRRKQQTGLKSLELKTTSVLFALFGHRTFDLARKQNHPADVKASIVSAAKKSRRHAQAPPRNAGVRAD